MKINVERKVLAGLITVLLLMAGIGLNSYFSIRHLVDNTRRASDAAIVRRNAVVILVTMLDLETGARGYVITGEKMYLDEYQKSLSGLSNRMTAISQAIGNAAAQQQRFKEFAKSVAAELTIVKRDVELREKQDFDAALRNVKSGDGKREMDHIRKMVAEIVAEQDDFISEQNLRGAEQARRTIWTICIGSVCGFLFVAASCFLIHNDLARRRQAAERIEIHAAALLRAHDELSQAGELMRVSEARMGGIVNSATDAIISVDSGQRIFLFNAAAEKMFRCTAGQALGQPIDTFIPERFREQHHRHVEGFGKTGVTSRSVRSQSALSGLRADGEEFFIEASISQVEFAGQNTFTVILRDITERNRVDDALRKSEAQLQTIVDNIDEAVVVADLNGELLHFNRAALNSLGYDCPDEGRRQMTQLVDTFELSGIDGTAWAVDQWPLARILRGERLHDVEGRMRRIGADWERVFSFGGNLAHDAGGEPLMAIVTFSDITARKRAEDAVRSSEARLNFAMKASHIGAWDLSLQDNTAHRTLLHDRIFGYDTLLPVWTYEMFLEHVLPEDRVKIDQSFREASAARGVWNFECRIRRADGEARWIWAAGDHERDFEGKAVRMSGIVQDITERKQAEEKVRQLNTELEQRVVERTAQLQTANNELEAFSYSVSHDLRSPLRSLDGFSQALLEDYADKLDQEGQDHLQRIRGASQRMGNLIDDLLNLSRLTRVEMNRQTVDLSKMAHEVADELRTSDPGREVSVVVAEGLVAEADPRLLQIVLTNLFANAWKFSGNCPHARIEFGCEGENGKKAFFVRDNGAGFDMAYSENLFGAFQRLHAMHDFPGTGIGLTIVKRIINRHGGRVWAESAVDDGATFHFTL